MRFTDRSRIVNDWGCPRRRYWAYEYGGRGISPNTTSLELWIGTTIHDALAAIAKGTKPIGESKPGEMLVPVNINQIATESREQIIEALSATQPGEVPDADTLEFAREQGALVEGLIRGFYRHVWPRLLPPDWRIVAVEQECTYTLAPDLKFMSRPDLVVEDPEGNWWYVEYKSTSSKKQAWIDQWATAVQLHSGCKAVEETLGHPVTGVIVQGLYKGYESYGKQSSPFCYAYARSGQAPFYDEQVRYDYSAGFRRSPTWEREGGVKRWVEGMPDDILADQFPQAPPIFVSDELVDRFFAQVRLREEMIQRGVDWIGQIENKVGEGGYDLLMEQALDEYWPQHFDQCSPGFGRGCAYKRLCHGRIEQPLEQGFVVREPHHEPEMEALNAAE